MANTNVKKVATINEAPEAITEKVGVVVEENIIIPPKKTLVYMQYGRSWTTGSGTEFTKEHPYQLVEAGELEALLKEDRFRIARVEDLKAHYQMNPPADINELVNGDILKEG